MPLPRNPRDDDAQAATLSRWQMERAEMRKERREARVMLAAIVAVHAGAYTGAVVLVSVLAVAWNETKNDAFLWPILLIGGGLAYGVVSTFVTHREVEL